MIEIDGFLELATKLGEVALKQHEMEHHALEKAAKLVEKRAKEKIGQYQEQVGPFVGWAELADFTKEDRLRQGYTENDPGLRSGQMRDSIEHVVTDGEAQVGSNDDNLVFFELGTSKQPPRSVLAGAAIESTQKVLQILGENMVMALEGKEVHNGKIDL